MANLSTLRHLQYTTQYYTTHLVHKRTTYVNLRIILVKNGGCGSSFLRKNLCTHYSCE